MGKKKLKTNKLVRPPIPEKDIKTSFETSHSKKIWSRDSSQLSHNSQVKEKFNLPQRRRSRVGNQLRTETLPKRHVLESLI